MASCPCPCSCWATGMPDDDGTPGWCDACRMNMHAGDRPRPKPVAVPAFSSTPWHPVNCRCAECLLEGSDG